jgi:hypothetical protein
LLLPSVIWPVSETLVNWPVVETSNLEIDLTIEEADIGLGLHDGLEGHGLAGQGGEGRDIQRESGAGDLAGCVGGDEARSGAGGGDAVGDAGVLRAGVEQSLRHASYGGGDGVTRSG